MCFPPPEHLTLRYDGRKLTELIFSLRTVELLVDSGQYGWQKFGLFVKARDRFHYSVPLAHALDLGPDLGLQVLLATTLPC